MHVINMQQLVTWEELIECSLPCSLDCLQQNKQRRFLVQICDCLHCLPVRNKVGVQQ
jgi:hypothetical protein